MNSVPFVNPLLVYIESYHEDETSVTQTLTTRMSNTTRTLIELFTVNQLQNIF